MHFKKILVASLAAVIVLTGCGQIEAENLMTDGVDVITEDQARDIAESFVNNNLLQGGITAEVTGVNAESGLFVLDVKLSNDQEVKSLLSVDGKIFVPEAMYIEEIEAATAESAAAEEAARAEMFASLPKQDKPVVELFIMSHCPFGTQAEKAIIPAVEKLGDAVDFQLKFVNYAMHGEVEVTEQLLQYAISVDYPEKLIPYLKSFLGDGNTDTALEAVGLTRDDLAATVAATDAQFELTKNLEDQSLWLNGRYPKFMIHNAENTKYGVQGSPTLVVNGQKIDGAQRTAAGMLSTICAGMETPVAACEEELSTATPSSGFGYAEGGASGGECG